MLLSLMISLFLVGDQSLRNLAFLWYLLLDIMLVRVPCTMLSVAPLSYGISKWPKSALMFEWWSGYSVFNFDTLVSPGITKTRTIEKSRIQHWDWIFMTACAHICIQYLVTVECLVCRDQLQILKSDPSRQNLGKFYENACATGRGLSHTCGINSIIWSGMSFYTMNYRGSLVGEKMGDWWMKFLWFSHWTVQLPLKINGTILF